MEKKINNNLRTKLSLLPDKPGCYKMFNNKNQIIYIGKAKILKNRVRSYFTGEHKDEKTKKLVSQIFDFDIIITRNEEEALVLEANLIREYKPKYNILLKDDKHYPYLKITLKDDFPMVKFTRKIEKDGAKYFGPYTNSSIIRKTMKVIEWIFPLKTCDREIVENESRYQKACLNHQLGKCLAPCINKVSKEKYHRIVKNVIKFLQGKNKDVIEDLTSEMIEFSSNLQFEEAAKIRDQIANIEQLNNQHNLYFFDEKDRDVVGYYRDGSYASVSVLKVLSGRLLNKEIYSLENVENSSDNELLSAFLIQYYSEHLDKLPHQILLQIEPNEIDILQKTFQNKIFIPQRGENRKLIFIAKENAFNYVEEQKLKYLKKKNRTIFPIQELKEKLGLKRLPRKIACFDISTFQGTDTVSSMVYFENGKPKKKNYRHFIMKTIDGQDDFGSMKETLTRVLSKIEEYEKPDLFVIDGGKGQLSSANQILQESDVTGIEIISLAKRIEEVFLPNNPESVILPRNSSCLRLLVNLRDEAHRFAITFHRKRRSKRTISSQLDEIKGIGEETKFLLLKKFGSVENIKNAEISELVSIKGIGKKRAEEIINSLRKN